jgi:hypothetical protein
MKHDNVNVFNNSKQGKAVYIIPVTEAEKGGQDRELGLTLAEHPSSQHPLYKTSSGR